MQGEAFYLLFLCVHLIMRYLIENDLCHFFFRWKKTVDFCGRGFCILVIYLSVEINYRGKRAPMINFFQQMVLIEVFIDIW